MSKARLKETENIDGKRIWIVEFDRNELTFWFSFDRKSDAKRFKLFHDETNFRCGIAWDMALEKPPQTE